MISSLLIILFPSDQLLSETRRGGATPQRKKKEEGTNEEEHREVSGDVTLSRTNKVYSNKLKPADWLLMGAIPPCYLLLGKFNWLPVYSRLLRADDGRTQ